MTLPTLAQVKVRQLARRYQIPEADIAAIIRRAPRAGVDLDELLEACRRDKVRPAQALESILARRAAAARGLVLGELPATVGETDEEMVGVAVQPGRVPGALDLGECDVQITPPVSGSRPVLVLYPRTPVDPAALAAAEQSGALTFKVADPGAVQLMREGRCEVRVSPTPRTPLDAVVDAAKASPDGRLALHAGERSVFGATGRTGITRPPVPFALLRLAYQWARDTARDNDHDKARGIRDYWPECVRELVADWRAGRLIIPSVGALGGLGEG